MREFAGRACEVMDDPVIVSEDAWRDLRM